MKTADYKAAAMKIEGAMVELYHTHAEAWQAVKNPLGHAKALLRAGEHIGAMLILQSLKNAAKAQQIMKVARLSFEMVQANNALKKMALMIAFIEDINKLNKKIQTNRHFFRDGGRAHGKLLSASLTDHFIGESEESKKQREEYWERIRKNPNPNLRHTWPGFTNPEK